MTESIRDKVIRIIAEQAFLEPTDVEPDASPEDLGIDSMGLVESVFAIEEAFNVSVPFNANEPSQSAFDVSTVDAIISAVEDLVRTKN
jgi:acyl carrier protein